MRKGPTLKVALIDWKFPHTETHRNMNVCNALLGTLLLVFFVIIAPNGLVGLFNQYFGRKVAEVDESKPVVVKPS